MVMAKSLLLVILFFGGVIFPFVVAQHNEQIELVYDVYEEQPVGTIIANILTDAKLDQKYPVDILNSLTFSFLDRNGRHNNYLALDTKSGIITISRLLDREAICPRKNTCKLNAHIAVQPTEYYQIVKVTIKLLDANDNVPYFPKNKIFLTVSEGTLPGIAVASLPEAVDQDSGEYKIQGYKLQPSTSYFSIGKTGGHLQLTLSRLLDRESKSRYEFTIIAFDGGTPNRSGSMAATITVSDINDNYPKFENESYKTRVLENATLHTNVLQVRATDLDTGKNAAITYAFSEDSKVEHSSMFDIDRFSGIIYVSGKLKYKKGSPYDLSVIAKDGGDNPLSTKTIVSVSVVDVNDNAPKITVRDLKANKRIEILENSAEGSFVVPVSVDDQDDGENGRFECKMDSSYFHLQRLYATEYKIVTSHVLDREVQTFMGLNIVCKDFGKPRLTSTSRLTVFVLDENDHPPEFSQRSYFKKIRESHAIGTPIMQINATDKDYGINAQIVYSLSDQSNNILAISSKSGIITSNRKFDRELMQDMEAVIIARDNGNPSRTATATLFLTILDVNDERPKFSVPSYSFYVMEELPIGASVGRVYATDADAPPYNQFTFSLEGSLDVRRIFTIDSENGGIRTSSALQTENKSLFNFVVLATEAEAPWFTAKANVSVFLLKKEPDTSSVEEGNMSLRSLPVILGLSGALTLLLLILVLAVLFLCKRRRRQLPDRRGYISGNLIRISNREGNVLKTKGELVDGAAQGTWGKLYQLSHDLASAKERDRDEYSTHAYPLTFKYPQIQDGDAQQKSCSREALSNAAPPVPSDSDRSIRPERRRASQGSRAGDVRRKAADGASGSRVACGSRGHCRSSQSVNRDAALQDLHKSRQSLRRHGTVKDSDSACSADVSNSDSNCPSDEPEGHRRSRGHHSSGRSREYGPPFRSRGAQKRYGGRRFKAESLSSPDLEMVPDQLDNGAGPAKDDCQAGPSCANRIALVHPQRNGENPQEDEQISLSDSGQGARGSDNEEEPVDHSTDIGNREYEFDLDSDTGSSGPRADLANRIRPEGQSQARPAKSSQPSDKSSNYGSCVNDTDFYESDSESRGRNILV